jgi:hypothetical protein
MGELEEADVLICMISSRPWLLFMYTVLWQQLLVLYNINGR